MKTKLTIQRLQQEIDALASIKNNDVKKINEQILQLRKKIAILKNL